jgi:hypothetical protein
MTLEAPENGISLNLLVNEHFDWGLGESTHSEVKLIVLEVVL